MAVAYGFIYITITPIISTLASLTPTAGLPLSQLVSIGVLILDIPVLHIFKTLH